METKVLTTSGTLNQYKLYREKCFTALPGGATESETTERCRPSVALVACGV